MITPFFLWTEPPSPQEKIFWCYLRKYFFRYAILFFFQYMLSIESCCSVLSSGDIFFRIFVFSHQILLLASREFKRILSSL